MDIKSKVILEIDDLLSEYIEKKDSTRFTPDEVKDYDAILGAIDVLQSLKKRIEGINVARHKVLRIVEEPSSPVIRPPASFLNEVLFDIEETLKQKLLSGNRGSGANPDAMPGREEACMRIKRYVYELHDELIDE